MRPSCASSGSSTSNFAQLTSQSDPCNVVNVSFALPLALISGEHGVPITFGTASARVFPFEGGSLRFNPASGVNGYPITTSQFSISLGEATTDA